MRPVRVEIEGFTSFREPTVVDLEGADHFVFVGPTGSGKSSVIDAICFALYGSVPRYENRNLVAPAISQGRVEAKVRLDFEIGGKSYTAARVVRRQSPTRATTREARLECDGDVIAGTADEVTKAVTGLTGLTFEHFTRCVVLPQGEFARFLHDKPATRQDMIVQLLNLGIYERMRAAARKRADEAAVTIKTIEQRLETEFVGVDASALKDAKARAKKLDALRKKVSEAQPRLNELDSALRDAEKTVEEARSHLRHLKAVDVPKGIADLSQKVQQARERLEAAEKEATERRKARREAEALLEDLPERAPLERALTEHDRKKDLADRRAVLVGELDEARTLAAAAAEALQRAGATLQEAETLERDLQRTHAAHHVAQGLEEGAPCPVCLQDVQRLPEHPPLPALEEAATATKAALTKLEKARVENDAAAAQVGKIEGRLEALDTSIAESEAQIALHPDAKEVKRILRKLDEAGAKVRTARELEDDRSELEEAQREVRATEEAEAGAWTEFGSERDALAALKPPATDRKDLGKAWSALADWAAETAVSQEEDLRRAEARVEEVTEERNTLVEALGSACKGCEVDLDDGADPLEATLSACAEAAQAVRSIEGAIARRKELEAQHAPLAARQKLSGALAHHLSAKGFERWVVDEALARLVAGASEVLNDLSGGQYSLTVDDDGSFQVTDHHNAEETRSARTLSGGETFLASLSLALSLSDQLLDLAAQGAARLDAIFLDEGFGTLDPDTLDAVAASIENLALGGRMVGVVTHVRELAERIPLQFRVTKDIKSSRIERVEV